MTTEEKFKAAVNVIRGLPKKGSFTPSTDLMLKFYGLFKQATEGPNTTPKPYMWEIIKKAKWDAWNNLGNMDKEDAMIEYLRELNTIVEQMGAVDNVEDFLQGMDEFYAKVPAEDVDLCIGPTIEKIKARSSKPLPSHPAKNIEKEDDEDDFLDSMDTMVLDDNGASSSSSDQIVFINGHSQNGHETTTDILTKSLISIRTDLTEINKTIYKIQEKQKLITNGRHKLFGNLSPQTTAFIILWPVLVNLGLIWMYSRRKRVN